jgi:hypothetical protein
MKIIKIPIAWLCGVLLLVITAIIIIPTFLWMMVAHKLNINFEYDTIDDVLLWTFQKYKIVEQWSIR